MQVLTYNQ